MAAIVDSTSARPYLTTTVRRLPSPRSRCARTVAAICPVPTGSVVTDRTLDAVPAVPSTVSNHCGVSWLVSSTTAGSGCTPSGAVVDGAASVICPPRLSRAPIGTGPWPAPYAFDARRGRNAFAAPLVSRGSR